MILSKPEGECIRPSKWFSADFRSWWLNLACAYRDGVTASPTLSLNSCPYGVTTLVILSGLEVKGEDDRTFIYHGQGISKDVPTLLIKCNMGRPIRLLRGSKLDSSFAPRGGIRYDGL